jgi:ADP-heptose:LPS heptosyltransferase
VIFSRHSGIGDIICTLPAAMELKKRHPSAHFIYNCFTDYSCVPRMGGVTDHVTTLPEIGVVSYWYRWLLGGYYTFASDDDHPVDHTEIYIKGYASRFGIEVDGVHPRLHVAQEVAARMRTLLKDRGIATDSGQPLVFIHPGPTLPVKEWSRESWTALVRELRARGFTNIVQLGVGKVMRFGDVPVPSIPGVIPVTDSLTLEESITLISLGALFIGVDSGLLHAAVSLDVPTVGIWGATSPRFLYAPEESRSHVISPVECQGCHHRVPMLHWDTGCPYDIKCMPAIAVEDVLQACLSRLQKTPG